MQSGLRTYEHFPMLQRGITNTLMKRSIMVERPQLLSFKILTKGYQVASFC